MIRKLLIAGAVAGLALTTPLAAQRPSGPSFGITPYAGYIKFGNLISGPLGTGIRNGASGVYGAEAQLGFNSAISLVYYVNVIWRMYTVEPAKRDRLSTPRTVTVTMAFSVVAILALTVAFGVLLNSLGAGASSLFTLSK